MRLRHITTIVVLMTMSVTVSAALNAGTNSSIRTRQSPKDLAASPPAARPLQTIDLSAIQNDPEFRSLSVTQRQILERLISRHVVQRPATTDNAALNLSTSALNRLQEEIQRLRARQSEMEDNAATGNAAVKTLVSELKETRLFAGLTKVTGPGIVLTLNDSARISSAAKGEERDKLVIHDQDILMAVQDLIYAGAEAISINGQRIYGSTAIRAYGPLMRINGISMMPPYRIEAIGESSKLSGALNIRFGLVEVLRRADPTMCQLESKKDLILPAYFGSIQLHVAKPQ